MSKQSYSYIIIGAGVSGTSATEGIRELDPRGSILLLGAERDMPYDRPPLSKQLWTGVKSVGEVFLHDEDFYRKSAVDLRPGVEVVHLDAGGHCVRDSQGKHAGRNMAGAREPFTYMPFFFSDLFEFGYEAVGDVDGRLTTFADWQEENNTGVVYYLEGARLRGVMMCNIWGQVDAARALIRKPEEVSVEGLRGAIQ